MSKYLGYRKIEMNIRHYFNKIILLITKCCFFISNKLRKVFFRIKKAIKFHTKKKKKHNRYINFDRTEVNVFKF